MTHIVSAILCGGSGSRLWPMSRAARPKQLLPLVGEHSLLATTVTRALALPGVEAEDVVLIAGEAFAETIRQEAARGGAPGAEIIVEPQGRNTAPAAALAAFAAEKRDPDALVLLLPSDHHVGDLGAFRRAIEDGAALAASGHIVTFGITPSSAHTGYGYIARGPALERGFRVAKFDEKPNRETAERFLAEGGRDWNSGIYMFHPKTYLDELARFEPEVLAAAHAAYEGSRMEAGLRRLDPAAWALSPSISIDNAVAERTALAAVVPADMAWSDIGSWSALWEIAPKDERGNLLLGDVIEREARDCYVRAESRLVTLIGVRDLVVVETADAVFIAPRDRTEEVKKIVESLAARGDRGPL